MDWFSDLVSGSSDAEPSGSGFDPVERGAQLLEGVASSAAALDDEHAALATRAETAARRIAEGLRPGDDAEGPDASEALDRLDGLHFALLRVVVRDETPEEAGVGAALEAAEELADRLDGSGAAPAGAGPG